MTRTASVSCRQKQKASRSLSNRSTICHASTRKWIEGNPVAESGCAVIMVRRTGAGAMMLLDADGTAKAAIRSSRVFSENQLLAFLFQATWDKGEF
jgi:hypothetical protein